MRYVIAVALCLLAPLCAACSDSSGPQQQETHGSVAVPKSDIDYLKDRVEQLEREVRELKGEQRQPDTPASPVDEERSEGGRQLALPDISLIVQTAGRATNDSNDPERQKLQVTEAELGVQGYVYPNVKADAYFATCPAEEHPMHLEEGYLTYLGVARGLNFIVGQKFVPFDRVNQIHNHSWLYTRQPLVLTNLVAAENLTGQGAMFSYLLPTRSSLFAQLDMGVWANGSEGEESDLPDIVMGPGADLTDRFETARLWASYPTSDRSELEFGGSWAGGKSNEDLITGLTDYLHLRGLDLTYRRFGEGARRLLLRTEAIWRNGTTDSDRATAGGYYLLGSYRWNRYNSLGLLYDWSEFPQDTALHESAMSLIYTRQFSEQYYVRLQAVRGDRPDCGSYNEFWLQWCWGAGPHTHNLE